MASPRSLDGGLRQRIEGGEFVKVAQRGEIEADRAQKIDARLRVHGDKPNVSELSRLFADDVDPQELQIALPEHKL
jgi:hypothetical protein